MDYVTITDTLPDNQIVGNALIYTTGSVVEDIAAPASTASALFNNRLWLVDAEDQNLLWFSKQVIEAVPVEMSDLLTLYVAPTSGAQGSTGVITALAPMDDKLIIFKRDAIYYINGTGPDNTGANSQYSDPIFITSAVGCNNPSSIVNRDRKYLEICTKTQYFEYLTHFPIVNPFVTGWVGCRIQFSTR